MIKLFEKNLLLVIKKQGSVEHFYCKYQTFHFYLFIERKSEQVIYKKSETSSGKNWNYI